MSDSLPAVLAVDAGNSKTDLALVAPDGSLLGAARGEGMSGDASVSDKMALLADLIAAAQKAAGVSGHPAAQHICACVANADLPEQEEEFAAAVRAQGWSLSTEAVNDTFAVLRAGFADDSTGDEPAAGGRRWGVAVTVGAGINCVGLAPDGRTHRYLALGAETGDWGGGEGIGKAALWHASRGADGRGPATALSQALADHYRLPSVYDVAIAVNQGRLGEDRLRELPPVVEKTAADGDEVAIRIIRKQAAEVCAMALNSMRQLDLTKLATPVILGGGIMSSGDPLLMGAIRDGIGAEAPHAVISVVTVPPIAGAALLGLDYVQADAKALRRLRDAYMESS